MGIETSLAEGEPGKVGGGRWSGKAMREGLGVRVVRHAADETTAGSAIAGTGVSVNAAMRAARDTPVASCVNCSPRLASARKARARAIVGSLE
jgi:hypothetical protein